MSFNMAPVPFQPIGQDQFCPQAFQRLIHWKAGRIGGNLKEHTARFPEID